MKVTLCGKQSIELTIGSSTQVLVDSVKEWIGSLDNIAYFRASLKVRDKYFDILRCISKLDYVITYLESRVSKPYVVKLLNHLAESNIANASIELTLCILDKELTGSPYVGDLYLTYGITPVSRVLTYLRLRHPYDLIFDDVRFNLCVFTEHFKFVGCVLVDENVLSKEVVEEVVRRLLNIIKSTGLKLRYITWLLDSNSLSIRLIDY